MEKIIVLICLIVHFVFVSADDSTGVFRYGDTMNLQKHCSSKGMVYYEGTRKDNHFNVLNGFWNADFSPYLIRIVSLLGDNQDTSLYSFSNGNYVMSELYNSQGTSLFKHNEDVSHRINCKRYSSWDYGVKYDYGKNTWLNYYQDYDRYITPNPDPILSNNKLIKLLDKSKIVRSKIDTSEKSSYKVLSYWKDGELSISERIWLDDLLLFLYHVGLLSFFFYIIKTLFFRRLKIVLFRKMYCDFGKRTIKLLIKFITWSVYFVMPLFICLIVSSFVLAQLTTILVVIILLYFIFYILSSYYPIISLNIRRLLFIIPLVSLISIQFLFLNCSVKLQDGTLINVHWKRGTDVVKRIRIKKILNRIEPHVVDDNGEGYCLYLSPELFTMNDYSIIFDKYINYSFFFNEYLYVSYRNIQLVLDKLFTLSSVRFDIPTFIEYKNIENVESLALQASDSYYVYRELTSSYLNGQLRPSIDANRQLPSYEFVFIWDFKNNNQEEVDINDIVYYKHDSPDYDCIGFRLAYRPDCIGQRKIAIHGYLRSEKDSSGLPKNIYLYQLNGININELSNYESFQEINIESRYCKKEMIVYDIDNNVVTYITTPLGLEYYDYVPEFRFVGL